MAVSCKEIQIDMRRSVCECFGGFADQSQLHDPSLAVGVLSGPFVHQPIQLFIHVIQFGLGKHIFYEGVSLFVVVVDLVLG
jgi:hypothetical protein